MADAAQHGRTALMQAAIVGRPAATAALLAAAGVDVNARSNDGRTALMHAASLGHVEVMNLLIAAAGVDVNVVTLDGRSAPRVGGSA